MDPLDDLLEQLGDVEEEELLPVSTTNNLEFKEIDIIPSQNSSTSKEKETTKKTEDNSDDDEELYIHRKNLTSEGAQIENWLKKNSSTSGATSTDAWKSKKKGILTGLTNKSINDSSRSSIGSCINFDKFQISVRNPKVSSQHFGTFTAGMKIEKLSNLKPSSTFKEAWCTLAIVIEKGITKKSSNGNEYLIWKLHDLKDCQSQPTKLLMFGDAIKEHWKLPLGTVIALMSSQITEDTSNKKAQSVTLKVMKSTNIVEIGQSAHFGTCKGIRQQDGQKCSNFVNTSLSEYCVYHVMSAARKLSANRGVFNAVSAGPNIGGLTIKKPSTPLFQQTRKTNNAVNSPVLLKDTMKPAGSNSFASPMSNLKTTTKEEEKCVLEDLLNQRKNTFGARQMMKLKEQKEDKVSKLNDILEEFGKKQESNSKRVKHSSMGDFLKDEKQKEIPKTIDLTSKTSSTSTKMWPSSMTNTKKPMGARDAQEHAARLRAIALLKQKRLEASQPGALKRKSIQPATEESENKAKKSKSEGKMDEIKKLLARKSIHQSEANEVQHDKLQNHLNHLEQKEKIETFTTTCMAVQNVKVVTCNQCKYTSQFASEICAKENHKLIKHEAEKRFFKCAGCKKRTVCFEMMPIKHCGSCNENKWIRVAMKDERKVTLETENLLVRGEERTFVNT